MSAQQQQYVLEQQVQMLQEENRELRTRLTQIEERAAVAQDARARLMRGGWRLLIPLLDRQRVVRSFGKLATTASEFAGPPGQWPVKEKVLADTRDFLESCVRFAIRRRTLLLLFSLLAATVPAIQIWLVVQQNEIIQNQSAFFEIQVYDIVARSMTEGDRNARQMTGALLANAKLEFLEGVVEEAFDPGLLGVYNAEGVNAARRRLEDAAFRGHLVRAVVRGVEHRGDDGDVDADELYAQARPMFRQILRDTADRLPQVLRLGRQTGEIDDALAEQVDNYLAQVGGLLRIYSRLARAADANKQFFADIRPLLQRMGGRRDIDQNRFGNAYRTIMQDFLFDLALAPGFGAGPVDLAASKTTPEQALRQGLDRLRQGLGKDALDWALFEQQVKL